MRTWASSGAVLLACVGCASAPDGVEDSAPELDTGEVAERFAVSGIVLDLAGSPVVDVFVTVSTDFCIPGRTDVGGHFQVEEVDPGPKRLITYGETASNGLFASVVFPFEADSELTLAAAVVTPELAERWPIDPEAGGLVSAEGLTLEIEPRALTLAPFAPSEVQVARVPLSEAPPFVPIGVELMDLFALHPIQSTVDPPATALFPPSGLAAGVAVVFHSLNYDTGQLEPVAGGTIDTDGRPVTNDGEGLPELTWVGWSVE